MNVRKKKQRVKYGVSCNTASFAQVVLPKKAESLASQPASQPASAADYLARFKLFLVKSPSSKPVLNA